ncbi:hypothetical protein [Flavobacterium lipolyticum]|uniref:SprT-like domain-containing protein n=1 Tax=Flavobacterium lipolyticum TaxID=2893754 RepID=A0ABS8M040_9FLAO|nr:hypothetical protein [Flavobacterium sp. F-126]MCC9018163.1 hypothetical protein [Flavobacterium sp. F-126]
MKNTKKSAIFLMVLGVAVLTGRCALEEAGGKQKIEQSITVNEAKVWFEQYQSKVKIDSSFKNQIYKWDSATTETFENGSEAIVVTVKDNNLSDAYKGQKLLYLYPSEDKKEFSATLYEIIPSSESLEKIKSSQDLVNFNGYIIAWDLESGFVSGAKFENSNTTAGLTGLRVISPEEAERLNKSTAKSDPIELDEVIIRREKSENKQDYGGGGSAGGSYGGSLNSGSKGNSPKGYVKSPGGGGSGSSGSTTSENAQRIEEQISADKLDACTKAVLEKLKNLKQADLAKMITRFSAGGSVFNINMSTGQVQNNDANVWAQTTKTNGSTNDVDMVFNQDYIYGTGNTNPPTDLSVAATMAHEVIHAYLISLLNENKTLGASIIYDFPTIYEAYVQQEIGKNPKALPDEHHELIAKKYINAVASTIQEFHTGQPVTSGFPRQMYLDMAWGGLDKTKIFDATYPNDPNHKNYKDRERILNRIITEKKGELYGCTSPVGTPCKK